VISSQPALFHFAVLLRMVFCGFLRVVGRMQMMPMRDVGRWGQGLTADKMAECRWLKPQLVAQVEYAGWTT
jgi:hypothetical protein